MTAPALAFLESLPGVRHNGRETTARCPVHDDRVASLGWRLGDDGRVLLTCRAGCDSKDVLAAGGLTPAALFDHDEPVAFPREVASYDYRDAAGTVVYQVVRFDPKGFRQRRPDGRGGWAWNLDGIERLPYRLPELLASRKGVVIVEGEKDADRLAALGLTATCNAGGAGKWRPEWAPYFAGRRVVIIPDNDDPGRAHAENIAESLRPVAAAVGILPLDVPDKGDVTDWLDAGHTPDELRALLLAAPVGPESISERLGARTLDVIPARAPDPLLIDRLEPYDHTILYGPGGIGKGVESCHWIGQLVVAGYRVLILDYENHPDEWSRRIAGLWPDIDRSAILHVAPAASTWQGKRGALWDQVDDIRALADDFGATYLAVDSIVFACHGSDPLEAGTAISYAGALDAIGRPALSLGHVTKGTDMRYPFGSVFWHNAARMTWSLSPAPGGGERAILRHRKKNNRVNVGSFMVEATWLDGMLREVWERPYQVALADQIAEALRDGPLSEAGIVERLNEDAESDDERVKLDSVQKALRRGLSARPPRFRKANNLWENA